MLAISVKLGYLLGLYAVAGFFFVLYNQTGSLNYLWFAVGTAGLSALLFIFGPGGGDSEVDVG